VTTLQSPRLQALADEVAAGADPAAVLETFWSEIGASGTPLVEPGATDDHRLVTFLWRDRTGEQRNVVVVGGPATWTPLDDDRMTRLEGTDVWHRTYDVPHDMYARYQLSPDDSLEDPDSVTDWLARESTFCADPLNPAWIDWPANPSDPDVPAHRVSVLRLPAGPDPTVASVDPDAPVGEVTRFRLRSQHLGNERDVWVHVPAGADTATDLPLVVVLDGWVWACALPLAPGLDRLAHAGALTPVVVAMVDSLGDEARCRDLECHPPFLDFLAEELLPELRRRWPVTADPAGVTMAGQSLGGLAAAWTALERPDLVSRVISQSGSFWYERDAGPDRAELVTRFVGRDGPRVTYDLSIGTYEGEEMLGTNRRFRDAAVAAGHDVTYREYSGGHDWVAWQLGLLDAIVRLHRG
jgi:enterochelin esterase family protein